MNDLNSVYLVGRLTADPKASELKNGLSRLTFTLANNQYHYNEEKKEYIHDAGFFNIITFTEEKNPLKNYLKKGLRIGINGRLQDNQYISKTGEKKRSMSIVAFSIQLLEQIPNQNTQKSA